jgi:hypothetical protein
MAAHAQPQLVQIVREPITPGNERVYQVIEDEIAQACVDLSCPHPHLALEPLSGPPEVWWFNFFESEEERRQVTRDYENNESLMDVLTRGSERKSKLTGEILNLVVTYRPDLSRSTGWELSGRRFIVVTILSEAAEHQGSVFEAPGGSYFVLQPAVTEVEAERLASEGSPDTTVLAVRPSWGLPAKEWIESDPAFWRSNPAVSR